MLAFRLNDARSACTGSDAGRVALLASIAWLVLSGGALAQSANVNRYSAAPLPQDGFALSGAEVGEHLGFSASLHLDYADDPLIYEDVRGRSNTELVSLVHSQLTAHAAFAFGLYDIAMLYVGMPVHLVMTGDELGDQPTATGFGPGDLRFGARVRVHRSRVAQVALQLTMTAPTGEGGEGRRPGVAGDVGATAQPEVTAQLKAGPFKFLFDFGARWRKDAKFAGARFTDVLVFGASAGLPLFTPELEASLEARGETPMDDVGDRSGSPLEALLGLKLRAPRAWTFGAAGGVGILRGYGSPDMRFVVMAGYTYAPSEHPSEPEAKPEAKPASVETRAPEPAEVVAAPPLPDRDKDGIADDEDSCAQLPGTIETAGCPQFISYDPMSGQIALLHALRFEGDPSAPHIADDPALDELLAALHANPQFKLRVESHRSHGSAGSSRVLLATSVARAAAVAHWLIAKGIATARLEAIGCGAARPVVPDRGAGRVKNERIELYVTDPLPPSGMRSSLGCEAAPLAPAAPPPPPAPVQPPKAVPAAPPPPPPAQPPKPAPAPAPAPAPKPTAAPSAAPTGELMSSSILAASTTAAAVLAAVAAEPQADRDKDGVANGGDQCPLAPGKPSAQGCPEFHKLDLDAGQIELLKPVRFHDGESQIHSQSFPYLDEVAATLRANPDMKLLIEVHVAGEGSADKSLEITRKRAAVVRDRLKAQGIAPARLRAYGCGESRPIAPNNVPWGRKKNDRVELHVLDPASPSGVHSMQGCSTSE